MYAIRKSDLKSFTPNSKAVCAIQDGSTNTYLREDRAIEEFLKSIEPNYNPALEKLATGNIDQECIFSISGFVAYVNSCSPGGMRIQTNPLKAIVETTAAILDAKGAFPPPPAAFKGKTLTDLLSSGTIEVAIDPKFPQAVGIDQIVQNATALGNFTWEVLQNPFDDNPFFTSDFPIAIEKGNDPRTINRIVPLSPDLAIRIIPDLSIKIGEADPGLSNFRYQRCTIGRSDVMHINRLIVRCAEEMVFYRDDMPWVERFVANNRRYRIEPVTQKVPVPNGTLQLSTLRIVAAE